MKKSRQLVRYQPPKIDRTQELLAENQALRERIAKLEDKILSLHNERAACLQWLGWLRGHVAAADIFTQPGFIAENTWKNPPPSWRAGGEGGRIDPKYPVKNFSGNNTAFFVPTDERVIPAE